MAYLVFNVFDAKENGPVEPNPVGPKPIQQNSLMDLFFAHFAELSGKGNTSGSKDGVLTNCRKKNIINIRLLHGKLFGPY